MALFTLIDKIEDFKCASGQKKTFIDPNGGKIEICAKWGSQKQCEVIETPKFLWSSGYKMPITLTLTPPEGKFVKDSKVNFKAGAEDYPFKAEWLVEAPPVKPQEIQTTAFGEMTKPVSSIEQQSVDIEAVLNKLDMIMGLLGDLINK